MLRVAAAEGLGGGLAQADVADLALLHELPHGADRLLDRRVRVHAMQVIKVDAVGAEALQRALDRAPDVLRGAVEDAPVLAALVLLDPAGELGGDDVLLAVASD